MRRLIYAVIILTALFEPLNAQVNVEALRIRRTEGFSSKSSLNFSHTEGNVDSSIFGLNLNLSYQLWRFNFINITDWSYGSSKGVAFKNQGFQHLRMSYIEEKVGFDVFLQGQYDDFKDLTFRGLAGGGFRCEDFFLEGSLRASAGFGLMAEYEELKVNPSEGLTSRLNSYVSLIADLDDGDFLSFTTYYQPKPKVLQDYRVALDITLDTHVLSDHIVVSPFYTYRYDSTPPVGVLKTDKTTGVRFGFKYW